MKFSVPELSLVVLVGPTGSGKSTFARRHFRPTEVLSSDYCRGLVSDDENSQDATNDAFDVLRYVAGKRLARGLLTVVDATNVQPEARKPLLGLAREHDVLPVAIVLNIAEPLCAGRNAGRADRAFGPHVIRGHCQQLRRSLRGRGLEREGFRYVHLMSGPDEVEQAEIERVPLWNNRKSDRGPFDVIGDVHGCLDELVELLRTLGYQVEMGADPEADDGVRVVPPPGRKAVFLGDLVDRGPDSPRVLALAMAMADRGAAVCLPGNHDVKLLRYLRGKNVQLTHGLAETVAALQPYSERFRARVTAFIDSLVGHYILDEGRLVVAHAGMKQQYIGRTSRRVREFALYGDTTGETDEFGLPVRQNWAAEYRGSAAIVYGHTPVPQADWLNRTINIDTGCVFGGRLTALRWPEREIVSVASRRVYSEPARPFLAAAVPGTTLSPQQQHDDVLDIDDVLGKRVISTRLLSNVTVREENAVAALEVMSRFAANPKWLIYLPPTMSPTQTSLEPGLLEHPRDAFGHFRSQGVQKVICEQKHMGSRAVVVVCRDEAVALTRFGISDDGAGIIYTRTGRRFFDDRTVETEMLERLRRALSAAGFWAEFASDWFCLDCELLPWSAKAQDLLKHQYAAVGSASRAALLDVVVALEEASRRMPGASGGGPVAESASALAGKTDPPLPGTGLAAERSSAASDPESVSALLQSHRERLEAARQYVDAYRRYCWPVGSVDDLKLAPFHLMASEGSVHTDKDHLWHMEMLGKLAIANSPVIATEYLVIDPADDASLAGGVRWWENLTSRGGEGMVVKPLDFVVRGKRGLLQPALKCRGREYLRIIYGPEYTAPRNLQRLRSRGLGRKRSLALREFALGVEALERFVRREPLRRVHECVFGVLSLESEPVDPRL